jgi:diguanylate cyclase (GGDEF)-like protein
MDIELERAYRDGHSMTLVLFDIDNFKKVNDTYGHPRGDTVLKAISATLEKVIRPSDLAARYGGEEFALVMPKTGLQGETAIIAERLRTTIENLSVNADGSIIRTTISIGVASYSPKEGRIDKAQIIAAADKALFTSKRMGKNRFTLADPIV